MNNLYSPAQYAGGGKSLMRLSRVSWFITLLWLISQLPAVAQTNPASVTVSGACLNGTYVLSKTTDNYDGTGKPAYSGVGAATLNATSYTNKPLSVYYITSASSWVLAFDGQPYQVVNTTNSLPPATGWRAVTVAEGAPYPCTGSNPLQVISAVAPTVATAAVVTNLATTGATVNGTLSSDGGAMLTSYGVVYVAGTGTPTISDSRVTVGTSSPSGFPNNFSANLTNLTPGTTYTARTYATNSVGTSYGTSVRFTTATTITSIALADPSPTNASQVRFTVIFATAVTGLSSSNFSVIFNGASSRLGIASISGSGTTYTVTVNTGTGSGTLRLDLENSVGLSPSVSNVPFKDASYTIDKTAPTVTITSSAGTSGSTTGTTPIPFTVTFSKNVTGFVATDLTVSGGTVANFTGGGATYTFDVTPSANGLVTVDVSANVAQDQANNGNTAASPFSITYTRPVTAIPIVTAPADGALITSTSPTYSGTAPANSTVTVYVDNTSIGTTVADGAGNFSLTQPTALAQGSHTVKATAQLSGQTVSGSSPTNTYTVVIPATVTTATPTAVNSSGATLGGNVTDAGAGTVSERGVVYVAGTGTPTTSDTKVIVGAGTGSFAQAVTNLTASTTYAVRAYAINQAGTSYGTTQTFSTGTSLSIGSVTPSAVCPGGTISVAYTSSSLGTPIQVYLNGPATVNVLLTTLASSQASGTITATIPANQVAGQYSVYLSGGGTTSGSVNITVNAIPAAPTVTSPVVYCQNSPASPLSATGISGASLNWYGANAIGGTPTSVAPVPTVSIPVTANYYVSQTANGCESPRAVISVTVTPLPQAPSTTPITVCQNTTPISLATGVTASPGASLNWYTTATGGVASLVAPVPQTNAAGLIIFYVSQVINGCESSRAALTFTVNPTPVATLSNDGPLTCAKTTVTLTAGGNGTYRFSPGATQTGSSNVATVNSGAMYSVTVTDGNGCSATTQTTVEVNTTVAAPTLTASALSTENTPINVTASGCSGTINWTATGGTGTANGAVYTVSQPGNYGLTATCTVGTCISPAAPSLTLQIRPGGFAITGVELVRCQLIDAGRGQYEVSLTPQYSGLSGSPLRFGITNELAITTAPGPYTIRLYTDNPAITLTASQDAQQTSYRYSWLAACNSTQPVANRPPVVQSIPNQVLVVGQPYQLELTTYFSDPEGQVLTFTATGIPAGLQLSGSRITGSPTQAGLSTVQLTALDPGGLQVTASVVLRVDPAPVTPTPGNFTIAGVTGVRCETVTASERRLTFSPVYTGLTGEAISFGITNEVAPTSAPGPYSVRLYTDNPAITLTATQGSAQASYRYNWLADCVASPGTPPPGNRPPVVGSGLSNQTAQVGQGFTLFIPAGTFTDPDNDPLQLSASGLPAGLSFSTAQNAITGTPAQAGTSTIQVTATDPGGLSTSTSFVLTVQPATTTPTPMGFTIAGVTGVRCETVTASERRLIFSPVYTGLTGEAISFGITNEVAPTSAPGPYSVRLYTDNPAITLTATQGSAQASYRYNWLADCATKPNGRQGTPEAGSRLEAVVLGNPVTGESVEVLIRGVGGQAVELSLTDLAGNQLHQQQIRQASGEERVTVPVSIRQAITILKVSTATQHQEVKLIRQ